MKKLVAPILILLLSALAACEGSGQRYLPPYSGSPGDVTIVMNDIYWDGESGEAVREVFEIPVAGLANAEYMFNYNQVAESRFGSLLKSHRTVVIAGIKDVEANNTPSIKFKRDVWSNGQLVIELKVRTQSEFIQLFRENRKKIVETINQTEKDRLMDKFYNQRNVKVKKALEEDHKLSLNLPKDFEIISDSTNGDVTFVWIRRQMERYLSGASGGNHPIIENVLVYYYPYGDTATFTTNYQLDMRDMMGKHFVPGPLEGSYMSTERRYLRPVMREKSIDSLYAFQVNGNWKLEGAFMGGPFINVSVLDEKRNRIITVDGFVYAPKFNKREYVRELEAMLYSLKILD